MIRIDAETARATARAAAKKARDLAAQIGPRYQVKITLPPADNRHLGWFDQGTTRQPPRPVMTINATVQDAARVAMQKRINVDIATTGRVNVLVALQAAAEAMRDVFVRRLSSSGGDITFARLSPLYAQSKRRRGLDPRIGVATGSMLAAMSRGLVVVFKI